MPGRSGGDRPRRRYNSPTREATAAATQARIFEAAADLFAERGYLATTVSDIAKRAKTSIPRVHLLGSKASLLVSAYCLRMGGDPVAQTASDTSFTADIFELATDEALQFYVDWLYDVHVRTASLWVALRDAAAREPEAARLVKHLDDANFDECVAAMHWAADRGLLHGDIDITERAQVWMMLGSADNWTFFVRSCGWTKERYGAWLLRTFPATVFDLSR